MTDSVFKEKLEEAAKLAGLGADSLIEMAKRPGWPGSRSLYSTITSFLTSNGVKNDEAVRIAKQLDSDYVSRSGASDMQYFKDDKEWL